MPQTCFQSLHSRLRPWRPVFVTQFNATFVALKLQLHNRACKPAALSARFYCNLSPRYRKTFARAQNLMQFCDDFWLNCDLGWTRLVFSVLPPHDLILMLCSYALVRTRTSVRSGTSVVVFVQALHFWKDLSVKFTANPHLHKDPVTTWCLPVDFIPRFSSYFLVIRPQELDDVSQLINLWLPSKESGQTWQMKYRLLSAVYSILKLLHNVITQPLSLLKQCCFQW